MWQAYDVPAMAVDVKLTKTNLVRLCPLSEMRVEGPVCKDASWPVIIANFQASRSARCVQPPRTIVRGPGMLQGVMVMEQVRFSPPLTGGTCIDAGT